MTGDPCRCEWLSVIDSFGQLPELLAEKPDGRRAASMAGLAVPQLNSAPAWSQAVFRLRRTWEDLSPVARSQQTPVNGYAQGAFRVQCEASDRESLPVGLLQP